MGITQAEWQESERKIIDTFFRVKVPEQFGVKPGDKELCTEEDCLRFGKSIIHANELVPTDNQGANSFTLISHDKSKIVQFRLKRFNEDIIALAHQIYGNLVPVAEFHPAFPLPVYSSAIIPGRVHVLQPFPSDTFPLDRQKRTVTDLGHFIAKAAFHPQPQSSYRPDSWTLQANTTLSRLSHNKSLATLAPELVSVVAALHANLPLLARLPPVLTHHDLSEVNILVDDTSRVTGVIDFDAAGTEAFGTCIWGVYECFLGAMDDGKWSFYEQAANSSQSVRQVLENAFWDALWEAVPEEMRERRRELEPAVRVAVGVGVVNRYFIRGMLDEIDVAQSVHRRSLEYARGILPAIQHA